MVVGALPQPPHIRFSSPGKGLFITLLATEGTDYTVPCEAFGEAAPSAAISLCAMCEIRGFSSALSALASRGDP